MELYSPKVYNKWANDLLEIIKTKNSYNRILNLNILKYILECNNNFFVFKYETNIKNNNDEILYFKWSYSNYDVYCRIYIYSKYYEKLKNKNDIELARKIEKQIISNCQFGTTHEECIESPTLKIINSK